MSSFPQITNEQLQLSDLPDASASWTEIGEFALSYNGFKAQGSFEACAKIANEERQDTLSDLRTCLFFEQRRWQHYGDEPDDEAMAYIRSLVEQIRAILVAGLRD